jgi:hypothetical protein
MQSDHSFGVGNDAFGTKMNAARSAHVYSTYLGGNDDDQGYGIMQYFGYLRRSADLSYLQWIETMNQTGGDYRTMINGFLNSAEYRQRFGQ